MTEEVRRPWWAWGCTAMLTPAALQSFQRFMLTYLAWMVVWIGMRLLLEAGLPRPLAWALASVPLLLGVVMVAMYVRFLRVADELLRKIQLEGIALGFGF